MSAERHAGSSRNTKYFIEPFRFGDSVKVCKSVGCRRVSVADWKGGTK